MSKLLPLADAIATHVEPGMHLNFGSTPSRSNAAIRELARRFKGSRPGFELSATGFHSTAHLLGLLRLGQRYIGCFFGDNYPTPRPNRLYSELAREGYELEHWSLWSYVTALAAGAFGHPYGITRSLFGTSLGEELARRGKYFELPDPTGSEQVGLVRALVPDITFLHAPAGDAAGNVVFSPPHGEGFYGALAARRGVIVTVERLLPADRLRGLAHLMPLPAHRLLAICEAPLGAHPQPLHVAPRELLPGGYRDDYEHYQRFRALTEDGARLQAFSGQVLDAADGEQAYRAYVGAARLESLRTEEPEPPPPPALSPAELEPSDTLVLLAARTLARRVRASGYRSVLAGIGQAFAACRLADQLLGADAPELMVETGFAGIDVLRADGFLLAKQNVATAARLSSVESTLGALCCGGAASCIGVIGAAQVDVHGNVNSTRVDGELLVGAGGATDIAAGAREVIVLTRSDPQRLVEQVEYVTSRGDNVRSIVTESCVLERSGPGSPWSVREALPERVESLERNLRRSSFRVQLPERFEPSPAPTAAELAMLARLSPRARRDSTRGAP